MNFLISEQVLASREEPCSVEDKPVGLWNCHGFSFTCYVATFHTRTQDTHVADTNAARSNTNVDQASTADSNFQSRFFLPSRQLAASSDLVKGTVSQRQTPAIP
jgi:hypothetical protein